MSTTWADDSEEPITNSSIIEGDAAAVVKLLAEQEAANKSEEPVDEDEKIETGAVQLHLGSVVVQDTETQEEVRYSSDKSFAELGLNEKLLLGIKEMGWSSPSRIQGTAIPFILKGSNVIAQAHHGSGKTGTFSLGMLSQIDLQVHKPQAILVVHTRELAAQCLSVIFKLGFRLGAGVYLAVGGGQDNGAPITQQIIVGTPGRIRHLMTAKDARIDPKGIKLVVFDEADVLLNQEDTPAASAAPSRGGRGGRGGKPQQQQRLSLPQQALEIQAKCPNAQTLLFSATFSPAVLEFAKIVCPKAQLITLQKEEVPLNNITQLHIDCSDPGATQDTKVDIIEDILESNLTVKQTIIFCNTINGVKLLANTLRGDGFPVSILHSALETTERNKAVEDFRSGKTKVLVSTNLVSRGLDVPDVSLVINFDVPIHRNLKGDCETYLHRIGRCGRYGRKGCSIALTFNDAGRKSLQDICDEHSMVLTKFTDKDTPKFTAAIREAF